MLEHKCFDYQKGQRTIQRRRKINNTEKRQTDTQHLQSTTLKIN